MIFESSLYYSSDGDGRDKLVTSKMSEIEVDAECIGAGRLGNDWHPAARDFNFEKPDGCMIRRAATPRNLAISRAAPHRY